MYFRCFFLFFNFYAYERPFMNCLYLICERKIYVRTHIKITRQWKSTLICGYPNMQMCHSGVDGFHNLSARTIMPDIKTTTLVDRLFPFGDQEI